MSLFEEIRNYIPIDETEAADQAQMLAFMEHFKNYLSRENLFAHFCASAFVVNPSRNKAIMVYHNIYDGWIAPGGHADDDADLLGVALREVKEETGLTARPLSETPFAIQSEAIMGHFKKGKYVPSHLHFNIIFYLKPTICNRSSFVPTKAKVSTGSHSTNLSTIRLSSLLPFVFKSAWSKN